MRGILDDDTLPADLKGLAALLGLLGQGSLADLDAMGYRVGETHVDRLLEARPDVGLDGFNGSFDTSLGLPEALDGSLMAALLAIGRDAERQDLSDQERCFERLSIAAAHLLDKGDAERSIKVLHLARQLLPAKAQPAPKPPVPLLRVRLFGDLEVELGGERLPRTNLHKGLVRTLFCLLVLNQGRGLPRESVIEWLWPSRAPERALSGFYNLWHRLYSVLPTQDGASPYFINEERLLRIDPRYVQSDVAEFERLARQVFFARGSLEERFAAIDRMEQLYTSDVLAGSAIHPRIVAVQERQRGLLLDVLLTASQLHLQNGDNAMALWYARRAFEADPKREDVYRNLMATQEAAGHRTGAMSTYQDCLRYLSDELGVLPSSKTTALYQDLLLDGQ